MKRRPEQMPLSRFQKDVLKSWRGEQTDVRWLRVTGEETHDAAGQSCSTGATGAAA
jgi:hypothetical protein